MYWACGSPRQTDVCPGCRQHAPRLCVISFCVYVVCYLVFVDISGFEPPPTPPSRPFQPPLMLPQCPSCHVFRLGKQKCKSCQGTGWIGPTVAPTPYIAADNQDTKATNESFGEVDPELGAGGEDTVDGDRAVSSNRSTSCSDGNSARIADNGHPLVGTSARAGGEVDVGVAGADVGGGGGGD